MFDASKVSSITESSGSVGGVLFKRAAIVDPPLYLQALWNRIADISPSSQWLQRPIALSDLSALSAEYSAVIVASGHGIQDLWADSKYALPFQYVRGQNLIYKTKNTAPSSGHKLSTPILRGEYLVPDRLSSKLVAGATHEYYPTLQDIPRSPCLSSATDLLVPKLLSLYPTLHDHYSVDSANAGIRVMPARSILGKIPTLEQHTEYSNVWCMVGLGARGLIHHAYLADMLVGAVLSGDPAAIPEEMRLRLRPS